LAFGFLRFAYFFLFTFYLALLPWLFSLWISTLKFIMDGILVFRGTVGKRYNLGGILLKV
jgi:hypothetical protein